MSVARDATMATAVDRLHVIVRATESDPRRQLEDDVRAGLTAVPPSLPPRWFYDERGSRLFDEITRLPEYYPTRRETSILRRYAADIDRLTVASTLVELGSGFSTKTRLLLDAMTADSRRLLFVPIDVSVEALTTGAQVIAETYPTVTVGALVADISGPLAPLPGDPGRRLIAFLGGTVGNFDTAARRVFLGRLRAAASPGDHLLLGADLVKEPERLVAAYDDSRGVTADFNRNVIEVVARDLRADGLDADDFEHVARWNAAESRIEMWLRALRDVHARFPTIDLAWDLPAGGELLTEISVKFRLSQLQAELAAAGFAVREQWTDDAGDFSVTVACAL